MKKKLFIMITIFIVICFSNNAEIPTHYEEGGLCTTNDPPSPGVVWNFIQHFTYEQYFLTIEREWTTRNNTAPRGVDSFDFLYFCGHGRPYEIKTNENNWVDLRTAGDNSHNGYGNSDLEFLVLHSCSVLPSPIDVGDAFTPWLAEPGGIFDGLHVLLGFRTDASYAADEQIACFMGDLTENQTGRVWENWVNAVNTYGISYYDKFCLFVAYRHGHFDDQAYDAYYDVYGGSVARDTTDPGLWCYWSD